MQVVFLDQVPPVACALVWNHHLIASIEIEHHSQHEIEQHSQQSRVGPTRLADAKGLHVVRNA